MESFSLQQSLETFHLLFLRHLEEGLNKAHYCVKGGCNLRFFFKSIRYSEDLDLDVRTVAVETLTQKINRILSSQSFQETLITKGITITRFSAPKQSQTTQRWKIQLALKDSELLLPTKIEFSRRSFAEGRLFDLVDPEIIQKYQLYPILCSHYDQNVALQQKLEALVKRSQTQARDLFDIDYLLQRGAALPKVSKKTKESLNARALHISEPQFQSQVVSYLLPEYQEYYGRRTAFEEIQLRLLERFEATRP
jgi:predicted nucleotidyltransferase component of viral defense system